MCLCSVPAVYITPYTTKRRVEDKDLKVVLYGVIPCQKRGSTETYDGGAKHHQEGEA